MSHISQLTQYKKNKNLLFRIWGISFSEFQRFVKGVLYPYGRVVGFLLLVPFIPIIQIITEYMFEFLNTQLCFSGLSE